VGEPAGGSPTRPPLALAGLRYDAYALGASGGHHAHARDEDALASYLQEARWLLASRPDRPEEDPTGLTADFEALRWFPLLPGCLEPATAPPAVMTPA